MNARHLVATLGSAVALLASSPSVSHGPQKELTVV